MARYIDTNYLFKCQTCRHFDGDECDTFCDSYECYSPDMLKIPTADVVEVKRGKWKIKFLYARGWDDWITCECTFCGWESEELLNKPPYKHCPNCGAKMDGDT